MKFTYRVQVFAGFSLVVGFFLAVIGVTALQVQKVMVSTQSMQNETRLLNLANQWLANVRQNSPRSLAVSRAPGKDMFLFSKTRWQRRRGRCCGS